MPTTPRLLLPYPVSTDTADVPRDIKALADRIEALTAWIRDADMAPGVGPQSGDLRFTAIPVATPTTISGWLLCDGGSYLRAGTYATLFAAIGTTYGSVDGTHFSVPDFRGRVASGVGMSPDAQGATAHALAEKTGLESAFLAASQIPVTIGFGYEKVTQTAGAAAAGSGQTVLVSASQAVLNAVATWSQSQRTTAMQPTLTVNVLIKI